MTEEKVILILKFDEKFEPMMWPHFTEVLNVDIWEFGEIVNFTFEEFFKATPNRNREKLEVFEKNNSRVIWGKNI